MYDLGLEGAQIEDKVPLTAWEKEQMFVDIPPESEEDDGIAYLNFFVEDSEDLDMDSLVANVKEELEAIKEFTDIGEGTVYLSETEDLDWINNWKEFFHPISVGRILVKPTWENVPVEDKDKILIEIDPGTAFGTGGHETTQLCMMQLEKYVKPGDEVCDIGTGSGILGIAALKLGAAHVVGTDLDDNAIDAVGDNCRQNGIETGTTFEVICGNIIDDRKVQDQTGYEKYDIIAANILAPVIIMLIDEVARHMKPGALFITSGIIDTKEAEVTEAFNRNPDFEIVEINHLGEWVNITARKK